MCVAWVDVCLCVACTYLCVSLYVVCICVCDMSVCVSMFGVSLYMCACVLTHACLCMCVLLHLILCVCMCMVCTSLSPIVGHTIMVVEIHDGGGSSPHDKQSRE